MVAFAVALAAAVVGGSWLWPAPPALACGGFFVRSMWKDVGRPSLAYEQTLVIHDPIAGREHFVRQVTFRASKEPFGFVVPTPTRPEVAKVAHDPFTRLRAMFPFKWDPSDEGLGTLDAVDVRGGGVGGAKHVKVLEQKKVGSFTVFVLSANDPTALSGWLEKQSLAKNAQAEPWLAHYVKLGFHFVALRYDPSSTDPRFGTIARAEVVRFSFDTPLPYYPYFEPEPEPGAKASPRMADIWLVSPRAGTPVAVRSRDGKTHWVRPFSEGSSSTGLGVGASVRRDLELALGSEKSLLPEGKLMVQRFVDQKESRAGFGDVLFLPRIKVRFDDRTRKNIESLLPVLDPSLAEGQKP